EEAGRKDAGRSESRRSMHEGCLLGLGVVHRRRTLSSPRPPSRHWPAGRELLANGPRAYGSRSAAPANSFGCSTGTRCAAPFTATKRAPLTASAIAWPSAGGAIASSSPAITTVGTVISASIG